MSHCKYCGRLSYYKHGEYMEPPYSVHPIAEWCILGIEVYSGTGQLSFLSPRGGKYIEIPRGARYHHGVLSFGGTYMEVASMRTWRRSTASAPQSCSIISRT